MTLDELETQFRSDVDDAVEPYLWSSTEFFRWLDDAQNEFCRRAYGIPDASSSITELSVTTDEPFADVSSKILKYRRAALRSTGKPLAIRNFEDMDSPAPDTDDYGNQSVWAAATLLTTATGPVHTMVIGMEENKVRWVNVPAVNDIVDVWVYRLPLKSVAGGSNKLEIQEQHHLNLLDWVKHRAYNKQDAETYDAVKAKDFFAKFRSYCDEARRDWELKKHKPRAVVYGGL